MRFDDFALTGQIRRAIRLLLLAMLTASGAMAQGPPSGVAALAEPHSETVRNAAQLRSLTQAAVKALAERSMAQYLAVHIRPAELSALIRFQESEAEVLAEQSGRFEPLLRDIGADGVDLAKAKLLDVRRRSAPRTKGKIIIIGDINVIIGANGRKYRLVLDDVLDLGKGWVIGDRIKWFGPIKP